MIKTWKVNLYILSVSMQALAMSAFIIEILYQVQERVTSVLVNGVVGDIDNVAMIFLAYLIGARVDRSRKITILIISTLVIGCAGLVPLLNLHGLVWTIGIITCNFIISIMMLLNNSAHSAYFKQVITADKMASFKGKLGGLTTFGSLAGIVLGAEFAPMVPGSYFFVGMSLVYLLSVLPILILPKDQHIGPGDEGYLSALKSGLKYISEFPALKSIIVLTIGLQSNSVVVSSLLVYFFGKVNPGFSNVTWLLVSIIVGVVIGTLISQIKLGRFVNAVIVLTGSLTTASTVGLGFSHNAKIFSILCGLMFMSFILASSFASSLQTNYTIPEMQARVNSLQNNITAIVTVILLFSSGVIVDQIGLYFIPFLVAGLGSLVGVASFTAMLFVFEKKPVQEQYRG